jgi:indole-3-glycerol phosphate synthase
MSILDSIVEEKRRELLRLPSTIPNLATLQAAVAARPDPIRDFVHALRHPRSGTTGLIAEIKKASPSAGVIRPDFDPVTIARQYQDGGADALSILTDQRFFQGSLTYLREVRSAVSLPLLRKDFLIDPRQILEAIEAGADAILLIVAILEDATLHHLHDLAIGAGLSVLVEVHDAAELDRALALDTPLIGVNNRDLRSFTVNLATTESLARRLQASPRGSNRLLVAESGIHHRSDVQRVAQAGAGAILVGESLMRHPDPGAKARELLSPSSP